VANGVRRLLFGFAAEAEVRAADVQVGGLAVGFRLLLAGNSRPVRLAVTGRHNVHNALAAAAAAHAIGIELEQIVAGLESFRPSRGRMEISQLADGITVLEDTYNANPLSMRAALLALDEIGGSGLRLAVLGDMLELGPETARLHREVGAEAAGRADYLVLLGNMAGEIAAGARQAGMANERVQIAASHEAAAAAVRLRLRAGARVLVKGSRGMKMEKVCTALREMDSPKAVNHC
ncbi:MAG: UDP-N-acetylmuramoyl-tripeptide--D-alanyl-D-alanine ligase, partial [Desulfuromonadales bacterium]|nr:UDP-N-acetylmuramoyl-tripeptide--D-alanyl-D-alanine ligase [Desulfuromonadales bacterium]